MSGFKKIVVAGVVAVVSVLGVGAVTAPPAAASWPTCC
jgi:hypothetical protein